MQPFHAEGVGCLASGQGTSGVCVRCGGRRPLTLALLHRWVVHVEAQGRAVKR